jgi:hypothetical protein
MKKSVKIAFVIIACLYTSIVSAQTAKQAKEAAQEIVIKNKIDNKSYTFNATYALPLKGGQRYLTSAYDLRVTKDSVIAYLPYFGQLYMNASLDPDDYPINFTSTKFQYKTEPTKKGGWSITIIPEGIKYVSKMQLDIFKNGTASLQVLSNFRDEISFNGDIKTP